MRGRFDVSKGTAEYVADEITLGGPVMQSIFTRNKTALITGASAGIGLEIARALASKLNSLVIVARRIDRLQQLAGELQSQYPSLNVAIQTADLAEPSSVESLLGELGARDLDVDVVWSKNSNELK